MPGFGKQVVTGPTVEPVSVEDIYGHGRIPKGQEAKQINGFIVSARQQVEHELQRQLVNATWDFYFDDFPNGGRSVIRLGLPPLSSVTSVQYYDNDDTLQTWTSTNYLVDTSTEPGRIEPIESESWPTTRDTVNAVIVRAVMGYGANPDDVPSAIRHAIHMIASLAYNNREGWEAGKEPPPIPQGVMRLLDPYRWEECA